MHSRLATILFVALSAASAASAQDIAPLYTPKTPIPRGQYKTWSLFLVNNPQWLVAESNDKLKKLYDQFQAFGRAIGPDHVAVWFWQRNIWQDASYYRLVDVNRSAAFCAKLKLAPGGGPYVVVTTEYPGAGLPADASSFLPTPLQHYSVVSLNNKGADDAIRLLTLVADKITAGRLADLNVTSEDYWSKWQRAFEAIRDFLSNRQMAVTIKTPFSEIQIK